MIQWIGPRIIAWTLPVLALMPGTAIARSQPTATEIPVRQADAAFWTAFNRCDQRAMAALFTSDAEFYHDKTGLKVGRSAVASSMMRGPCANPQKQRIRREAVEEGIRFDPLAGGFALLAGEHRFVETKAGEPERPSGMARFTTVWQRVGAKWQMRRIVSYDHGPERVKLAPIKVSSQALAAWVGDYAMESGPSAKVRLVDGALTLSSNQTVFNLVPIGPGRFGVSDRLVQFSFSANALEVQEGGKIVAQMRRVSAAK